MITLKVIETDTVGNLKAEIEGKIAIPPKYQVLVFASQEMDNRFKLRQYGICGESTLILMLKVTYKCLLRL